MAGFPVIANVTETLVSVIDEGLQVLPIGTTVEAHDLRTDPGINQARLTVFLYEVEEDASTRNRPRQRIPVANSDQVQIQKSDMTLLLRYLITPWSDDRRSDQIILGRVLQIFYDKPVISGADLNIPNSVLANTDAALKIKMAPLSLEDRTRVWHSVNQPYRLSITYEVRVVNIDSLLTESVTAVNNSRTNMNRGGRVRA